ncbi:MAG: hypothetical protein KatS3mg055_3293 [Chloroflexus sp.]|nr:MAG: hypothetical protein KatS3mg055_3293 [Chloroflexus sp.]
MVHGSRQFALSNATPPRPPARRLSRNTDDDGSSRMVHGSRQSALSNATPPRPPARRLSRNTDDDGSSADGTRITPIGPIQRHPTPSASAPASAGTRMTTGPHGWYTDHANLPYPTPPHPVRQRAGFSRNTDDDGSSRMVHGSRQFALSNATPPRPPARRLQQEHG